MKKLEKKKTCRYLLKLYNIYTNCNNVIKTIFFILKNMYLQIIIIIIDKII